MVNSFFKFFLSAKYINRCINYTELFKFKLKAPPPLILPENGYLDAPTSKSSLGNILGLNRVTYKDLSAPINSDKTSHFWRESPKIVLHLWNIKLVLKDRCGIWLFKKKLYQKYKRHKRGSQKSINVQIDFTFATMELVHSFDI